MRTDRATRQWIRQEFTRRNAIRVGRGQFCDVCLLSYPRSGNHAVRPFLEVLAHRPTLGEGDSERFLIPGWIADRPVFLRPGISIDVEPGAPPVAVKRHWIQEGEPFTKYVSVFRDPIDLLLRERQVGVDGQLTRRDARHFAAARMRLLEGPPSDSAFELLGLSFDDVKNGDTSSFSRPAGFVGIECDESALQGAVNCMLMQGKRSQVDTPTFDDSRRASPDDAPADVALLKESLHEMGYHRPELWGAWGLKPPDGKGMLSCSM